MAKEEVLRKQALELYLQGKKEVVIARELGLTRQWVHKWVKRYETQGDDWYCSRSHAPHNRRSTPTGLEAQVIETRQILFQSPYLESGAYAIWHRMKEQGIVPPSVATINRILRKHGMTRKKVKYQKSGVEYLELPMNTQLMDLIGPRYLRGGKRYYLLTIISNDTRHAGVYPIPSKSGYNITQSVISFWKSYSVPDFLQMDNELSFKGSNRHPRGLGMLLRTALELDVTPIFIPVREPWRNGVVERFNQLVERTLLLQKHKDFDELIDHSREFMEQHNKHHTYSTMQHKTPLELDEDIFPLTPLREDYILKERPELDSIHLNEIHFIRLVRSDLKISVLNTEICVDASLMYTYVEVILLINEHVLLIKQDNRVVQRFEFLMPLP